MPFVLIKAVCDHTRQRRKKWMAGARIDEGAFCFGLLADHVVDYIELDPVPET